jgi:HD-like signal output (HDOD) protein
MALASPPTPASPRLFGRFALLQMLGRSQAASTWLAHDPRLKQDVMLCVPRAQPVSPLERQRWNEDALLAARLKHPRVAEVLDLGEHDGWPFVSCVRGGGISLAERVQTSPAPQAFEIANWVADLLEGLAYAHDAGIAHLDIGLHNVLIDGNGHANLVGLNVGLAQTQPGHANLIAQARSQPRQGSERDVLMVGLLMHRLLAGHPALDDNDLTSAASRVGPEIVRLPWNTPSPVVDTLRAIVNRATDRQQRQRYLSARTLLSALQGWIKTNSQEAASPLLFLLDRLNSVGSLPGRPGMPQALQAALNQDTLRVDDFVDVVARNPTMGWEILRAVNSAGFGSRAADDGVTTLSRAIVLMGQQGLRRVAGTVRAWPGVLQAKSSVSEEAGTRAILALGKDMRLACIAGHIARLLVPFTVSDEEGLMAATSQRLGWLLVLYHFPDEAAQINRLMLPGPPTGDSSVPSPGMSQEAAASAVLGINLDDLTAAVLKHWGMQERLVQAARPLNSTAPVRKPVGPEEILRTVASLANELTDTLTLPAPKVMMAVQLAVTRYARALDVSQKECQLTIEQAIRLVDARKEADPVNPA